MVFVLVAIVTAVISGILLTIAADSAGRSGRWGINLNSVWDIARGRGLLRTVDCPRCGRGQAPHKISLNPAKLLWGGWICQDCGTRMDQWGKART